MILYKFADSKSDSSNYSITCLKRPLKKRPKIGFQDRLLLNPVKRIAECSKRSILQYLRPALSYHLSLRPLFCLFLGGRLRQVSLYSATPPYITDLEIHVTLSCCGSHFFYREILQRNYISTHVYSTVHKMQFIKSHFKHAYTVNPEIFVNSFKTHIFGVKNSWKGRDLPISVNGRVISPIREDFIFTKLKPS